VLVLHTHHLGLYVDGGLHLFVGGVAQLAAHQLYLYQKEKIVKTLYVMAN
jgi:hypothetical protein